MAYFGLGGQFGGWLQNPQFGLAGGSRTEPFQQSKSGRAASGGAVPGTAPRGNNTGHDVGPGVRAFGGQDNNVAMPPPPPKYVGTSVPQYTDMAEINQDDYKFNPLPADQEQDSAGDLNAFMEDLMGSDWYKKTQKGSELELPDKYQAPPAWKPEDAGIGEAKIDPMAVINAAKPGLQEQMNRGFADAAMRQGATGALMGTGYSKALGGVARNASNDLNKITMDTLFKSSENAADREQQSRQSALDRSQGTWGQTFGQDQDAWRTHGDWQQNLGKWGGDREMSMIQQLLSQFGGRF